MRSLFPFFHQCQVLTDHFMYTCFTSIYLSSGGHFTGGQRMPKEGYALSTPVCLGWKLGYPQTSSVGGELVV